MKKSIEVLSHPFVSYQTIPHKHFTAHITHLPQTLEPILIERFAMEAT